MRGAHSDIWPKEPGTIWHRFDRRAELTRLEEIGRAIRSSMGMVEKNLSKTGIIDKDEVGQRWCLTYLLVITEKWLKGTNATKPGNSRTQRRRFASIARNRYFVQAQLAIWALNGTMSKAFDLDVANKHMMATAPLCLTNLAFSPHVALWAVKMFPESQEPAVSTT